MAFVGGSVSPPVCLSHPAPVLTTVKALRCDPCAAEVETLRGVFHDVASQAGRQNVRAIPFDELRPERACNHVYQAQFPHSIQQHAMCCALLGDEGSCANGCGDARCIDEIVE